jgi:acetyl esterase/lipase
MIPTSSPIAKPIPSNFQPPDGSVLTWGKYVPPGTGPFYTIVVIHGGGFYKGSPKEVQVARLARDLQAQGYYVLAASYRLAPCGLINHQPDHTHPESGRPPEQTDDIKSIIRAARAEPLCNGHVAVLGGAAGGMHAAFVALDTTASPPRTYPNWCQGGVDDRPDCAIMLSGVYDFSDREDTGPGMRQDYIKDVENYTNTIVRVDPDGGPSQKSVSPVAQIRPQTEQPFKPMFAVCTVGDETPPHQLEDLRCTLVANGIDSSLYETLVIPGNDHGFGLWSDKDGLVPPHKIRDDALAFLEAHFKNLPSTK